MGMDADACVLFIFDLLTRAAEQKTSTSLDPKSEFQNIESSSRDFSFTRESQFFPRIHEQSLLRASRR